MSFGWSAGDIISAIELLYSVGKALKNSGKADEKYRETSLFLESLAATLERVRASDASVPIRGYVDALRPPVETFCENLKKRFEDTLGNKSPKDWQAKLRTLQKRMRYALFDEVIVQELKNDISTPLQMIQVHLNLQCFISLSALQSNLSALQPAGISDIERVIETSLIQYRLETEKSQETSRIREILEWVYPRGITPMNDVYEDFCSSLLDGSCEWLFHTEQYRSWLSDQEPSLLWITGIPGAGKTSLATRVIQRLKSSAIIMAYYFCNTNHSARCEFLNILQSWIWQFLSQDKSKVDKVASVRDLGAPPTEATMKDCLDHLVSSPGRSRTEQKRVVILDGLDECSFEVRRKLCSRLVLVAVRAKVLLFSRRLDDISDELQLGCRKTAAKFEHFHISSRDTNEDLTNFLETSVKERLRLPNRDLETQIVESLRAGADGMFQWAALMIEDLAQPGKIFVEDYLKVLQDLPRGIDALYGRILDGLCKSRHHERSQMLLQWIVCSRRPLTLEEVGEVLILGNDHSRGKNTLLRELGQTVRELCGTLVEVKGIERELGDRSIERFSVVTLIHASAKDFLLDQSRKSASFGALLVDSGEAHAQIAQGCLATICDENAGFIPLDVPISEMVYYIETARECPEKIIYERDRLRPILQQRVDDYFNGFRLMKYAVINWLSHLTSAKESPLKCHYAEVLYTSRENTIRLLQLYLCTGSGSSAILEDIQQLLVLRKTLANDQVAFGDWLAHLQGPKRGTFNRWHCFLDGNDIFDFLPPVHIAAFFDFEDFVQEHLRRGGDVNIRTFSGLPPLCLAARGDSDRSAQVLLQAGAELNFKGSIVRPLNLAIGSGGPYNVARLLLNAGADTYSTSEDVQLVGHSILFKACRVPFPNDPFTLQLVSMLLAHGAKGNLETRRLDRHRHDVPLQCLAQHQSAAKLVDLLLRNGANCESCCTEVHNYICNGHRTALLLACSKERPNMDVIRIFLKAGASVKAKCHDGRTALHMAAAHPVDLAELLLKFGAEVNVVSADGSLPIHEAVCEHNIPVLKVLINNGSQIGAKDEKGLSPLEAALEEGFDDAIKLLQDAGAEVERHETAAQPSLANTLLNDPEPGYSPRDENDQFKAFGLLLRPGLGVELPKHVVCRILDLAEYWVRSVVSCDDAVEVDEHAVTATEAHRYLQTARIAGRRANPVLKVRFVIRSHDQGWSIYPGSHGTFENSWTWFDVQILKRSGRLVDFGDGFGDESPLLTKNVHAKLEATEHDIVFGNGPRYRKCEWIDWLKPGDQLGITAVARFPGWVNHVEYARIEVFSTYLPLISEQHRQR